MNDLHGADDRALAALDPAFDARPSTALRERIARIPNRTTATLADIRVRHPGRRFRLVAAAAAALVAVGGGSLWLSHLSQTSTGTVALTASKHGEVPDPITLPAPAGPSSGDTAADSAYSGRARFTFPRFDTARTDAHAYAIDTSRLGPADLVRIATAFGVTGEPSQRETRTWFAGGTPGGAGAGLAADRGAVWYFSATGDPVAACVNGSATGNGDEAAYLRCQAEVSMPTRAQVDTELQRVIGALGMNRADLQVTITPDTTGRVTRVTASRVIAEKATPIGFRATVSRDGLLDVDAEIGDVVDLGDYRIVSPAEAVQRLNATAFGPTASHLAPQILPGGTPSPEPHAAEVPAAGSRLPWPVSVHDIVSGRLGLASLEGPTGGPLIVPAYAFTDSEGNVWSVIALQEQDLRMSAPWGGAFGG